MYTINIIKILLFISMSNTIIGTNNKKFAVLIGINYTGTADQLNGCINDAYNIKSFLTNKCNYNPKNIMILADDNINVKPTRQNIINSLNTIINKAINENFTELWLSYSGHGSQITDENNDEIDREDEVICPLDFTSSGFIIDDFIYNDFICKLPASVTLFFLMDCCHSGTICDLPFIYKTSLLNNNSNNKHLAKVYSISGCRDDQTSADAYINSSYSGAMTWSFLKALNDANYKISLVELVNKMRSLLVGYNQTPMLAISASSNIKDIFMQANNSSNISTSNSVPLLPNINKQITFIMTVDKWYKESKWNIWSIGMQKKIFEFEKIFTSPNQSISTIVSLPIGAYKLCIWDTYGDGGITYKILDNTKTLLSSKMTTGKYGEFPFEIAI